MSNAIAVKTFAVKIDPSLSHGVLDVTIKANWQGKYLSVHKELDRWNMGKVNPKGAYQVTHVASGFTVYKFPDKKMREVIEIAKQLESLGELWNFTDPKAIDLSTLHTKVMEILGDTFHVG